MAVVSNDKQNSNAYGIDEAVKQAVNVSDAAQLENNFLTLMVAQIQNQAQMLMKTHRIPEEWSGAQQARLRAMLPDSHWEAAGHGDVEALVEREGFDCSRQLYRRREQP